jgi:hypothetical protein
MTDTTTYIYSSNGFYFGFVRNGILFSRDGEYLGWLEGNFVWDKNGRFRGSLVQMSGHNYILRKSLVLLPIPKPPRPMIGNIVPASPASNIPAIVLPVDIVDAF